MKFNITIDPPGKFLVNGIVTSKYVVDPPPVRKFKINSSTKKFSFRAIASGPMGPMGPMGPEGGLPIYAYTAGENLSSGRVVIKNAGKVYYFNPNDLTHVGRALGITITSALTNASVNVQSGGILQDAAFSFTVDQPLYVAASGLLQSAIPATTLLQRAGLAMQTDQMIIEFDTAIIRT